MRIRSRNLMKMLGAVRIKSQSVHCRPFSEKSPSANNLQKSCAHRELFPRLYPQKAPTVPFRGPWEHLAHQARLDHRVRRKVKTILLSEAPAFSLLDFRTPREDNPGQLRSCPERHSNSTSRLEIRVPGSVSGSSSGHRSISHEHGATKSLCKMPRKDSGGQPSGDSWPPPKGKQNVERRRRRFMECPAVSR